MVALGILLGGMRNAVGRGIRFVVLAVCCYAGIDRGE